MEKEISHTEAENLSTESESPENNHEIASPPTEDIEEAETPPAEDENNNPEEPSPLEGRVAELEEQLEQSEVRLREKGEKLSSAQKSLAEAVSRYRTMLLESMPEAPESMVAGETVEEIDRSFDEARALVHQVRREVEEKLARERLPAGSPTRGPANFSALTPMEKIRSALST